jgi:hypothetical protein
MVQSSETVKRTPMMIAAVSQAHQGRMQSQHDWKRLIAENRRNIWDVVDSTAKK